MRSLLLHKFKQFSMLSTIEKKLHLLTKSVSQLFYTPSVLILSVFRSNHLQLMGLSALPLAEPIQHASDFSRFSFKEENCSNVSQVLKIKFSDWTLDDYPLSG